MNKGQLLSHSQHFNKEPEMSHGVQSGWWDGVIVIFFHLKFLNFKIQPNPQIHKGKQVQGCTVTHIDKARS